MDTIFVDTFYWVALINPQDDWHKKVLKFSQSLGDIHLVTTEEVLGEVLAFYSKSGLRMRQRVVKLIESILNNDRVTVVEQSHQSFLSGFAFYQQRLDKGYSLTDCISMNTMKNLGINSVLSHDKHFTQEGLAILFDDTQTN
ncbi:MAG: type II toxin-antitoxin system VapC family toxin [Waterburya sp.]